MGEAKQDHVDRILAQWRRERPDLDVEPMGILGRLKRLGTHLGREIEAVLMQHGLSTSAFDVLATLRRSGTPHRLSPGELLEMTMVSSGTMTNRIDQLEKAGLVERIVNPQDRRSVLIALTEKGLATVEEAVGAHVANQQRLTRNLTAGDRAEFDRLLKKFLADFE
ncbi:MULTISPECIES: MarR family winged helix-turn-helix transcriptional regulator [Rhizobium]|uniref:MarR family winged helix-turn-helix transcriptional regulator n=1 Tax=Rhizobium TaxID=379 RepID=UPI0007EBF7DF|nr:MULTISPECIES: MarR family transcriptional regulator [Rhizobium]ANK83942.1 MarR family transcriptional regulator protein [Rhizobium sp. N731]ANK89836.1 MarR family transcriptional regulator protein [Rhizobium sp. N6212]ANK95863.1 MarR family transcriptional regulator protein [Rhizobium sp. N621]ANL01891.1 MarR family transcriptional regulator protein [Rhizobium esperanzae]ANL08019.1 MarR family transcriptional regulator protein [Rhizobium sp. N1341]